MPMTPTGYKWTIHDMVTEGRAESVARSLFPDEVFSDACRCDYCLRDEAQRKEDWQRRIAEVREAMVKAFS